MNDIWIKLQEPIALLIVFIVVLITLKKVFSIARGIVARFALKMGWVKLALFLKV